MSMISGLIDGLRQMADGQATYRDARAVMLEAADTIWQLRDDLQRANSAVQDAEHDESMAWDRVRKAEAENAKLRKLCSDMWIYITEPVSKRHNLKERLARFDDIGDRMAELGLGVDE